jgi:hypothetical protein
MFNFANRAFYAECLYAECRYAECLYAECRYAECHYMLNDVAPDKLLWLLHVSMHCVGFHASLF